MEYFNFRQLPLSFRTPNTHITECAAVQVAAVEAEADVDAIDEAMEAVEEVYAIDEAMEAGTTFAKL